MSGEAEAAGDVMTGAVVGATVEKVTNAGGVKAASSGTCLNCGSRVEGAYCASCGQSAKLHRSLVSLAHDILHGVFHFEGKIWRTLPELFFHPGRLTRRYIDGERAKFVSPMALYLFTVFIMFATFSFSGGALMNDDDASQLFDNAKATGAPTIGDFKTGARSQLEETDRKLERLRQERAAPALSESRRAELDKRIQDTEEARRVMAALAEGNWSQLAEIENELDAKEEAATSGTEARNQVQLASWPTLERRFNQGLKEVNENPRFLLYKLKANGYKYSWALVPLSVPFLWLMFFWRRNVHMYDHAIFTTYSISFVMMLIIVCSIASLAGVSTAIWGTALLVLPPIHMYKQLRGTYGLSRFGAAIRLWLLLISITIIIALFSTLLIIAGLLG